MLSHLKLVSVAWDQKETKGFSDRLLFPDGLQGAVQVRRTPEPGAGRAGERQDFKWGGVRGGGEWGRAPWPSPLSLAGLLRLTGSGRPPWLQ